MVLTGPAEHFWARSQAYAPEAWVAFQARSAEIPVLRDTDEWAAWDRLGDAVVHIELREWADALVVAPLSANTLAKLAQGLCDNLLVGAARLLPCACVGETPPADTHPNQSPTNSRNNRPRSSAPGTRASPWWWRRP